MTEEQEYKRMTKKYFRGKVRPPISLSEYQRYEYLGKKLKKFKY